MPGNALAAAPTPETPAADATVTEGSTVTYTWTGDLQGDPTARDRAYFVVEVIAANKVPTGQQAPWPDADTARPTQPGQVTTSLALGAPAAGSWRWRVCAWGVVDANVANELVQLPDGCSASRTLTSKVPFSDTGEVAVIAEERKVAVRGEERVITKPRPVEPEPPVEEAPPVKAAPVAPVVDKPRPEPVRIQPRARTTDRTKTSALGLEAVDTELDRAADRQRDDLGASVLDGLTATIPGIPIPFWTLGFLLISLPIALVWRRSVLGMFEWSDGSIDGFGTPDVHGQPVLAAVQLDEKAHGSTIVTDVAATTGGLTSSERFEKPAA